MNNARELIDTSVSDAKATLDCMLINNPEQAKKMAEQALSQLPKPGTGIKNGHMTRIAMLRTIVRRADKLLTTSQ